MSRNTDVATGSTKLNKQLHDNKYYIPPSSYKYVISLMTETGQN